MIPPERHDSVSLCVKTKMRNRGDVKKPAACLESVWGLFCFHLCPESRSLLEENDSEKEFYQGLGRKWWVTHLKGSPTLRALREASTPTPSTSLPTARGPEGGGKNFRLRSCDNALGGLGDPCFCLSPLLPPYHVLTHCPQPSSQASSSASASGPEK